MRLQIPKPIFEKHRQLWQEILPFAVFGMLWFLLIRYPHRILFTVAVALFPLTSSAGTEQANAPATTATYNSTGKEIPHGFKVDRYASIWERNPFTLVMPATPKTQPSAFDKLFLTSWLREGHSDIIFIQNTETNESQKVTAEVNQNKLRLIALRMNRDPRLVEAVISNGNEQGSVKFRFDAQSSAAQTAVPGGAPKTANIGQAKPANTGQALNPMQTAAGGQITPPASSLDSHIPGAAPGAPSAPAMRPGGQLTSGLRRAPRSYETEAQRLPPPPSMINQK